MLDVPEKGVPLLDEGARADWRVCADVGDWGLEESLTGLVEARLVARPSGWYSSPSSETMSVMREDTTLGGEVVIDAGTGTGALAGERETADGDEEAISSLTTCSDKLSRGFSSGRIDRVILMPHFRRIQ